MPLTREKLREVIGGNDKDPEKRPTFTDPEGHVMNIATKKKKRVPVSLH